MGQELGGLMSKRIFFICTLLLCVTTLFACNLFGEAESPEEEEPPVQELPIIDISKLNYNKDYHNPDAPDEEGFILFDSIDFNKVAFTIKPKTNPVFYIYYVEEYIKAIEKHPMGTEYSGYMFARPGKYKIIVRVSGCISTEFEVNVRSCGIPDQVVTCIKDLDNNEIEEIVAGEQYKLCAEVYSDGALLPQDTPMLFVSYWTKGEKGAREHTFTAPNRAKDGDYITSFLCDCYTKHFTQTINTVLSVPIINNFDHIEIDYGMKLGTHLDYYVTLPVWQRPELPLFIEEVKAKFFFTNGESENILVHRRGRIQVDSCVAAFIRFDGQGDFRIYNADNYVFSTSVLPEVQYQFLPTANSAELYFAYCYSSKQTDYKTIYERIDDIMFHITIEH